MPPSPSHRRLPVPVLAVALAGAAAAAVHFGGAPPIGGPTVRPQGHQVVQPQGPVPVPTAPSATATAAPTGPAASPAATPRPATAPTPPPDGKSEPTAAPPPPAGYPYPVDASGDVRVANLVVTPGRVAAVDGPLQLRVVAAGRAWVPGQAIFVYVGQRFALRLPAPGATGLLGLVPARMAPGSVVISGFQFPQNSPSAPVDGAATASLLVVG